MEQTYSQTYIEQLLEKLFSNFVRHTNKHLNWENGEINTEGKKIKQLTMDEHILLIINDTMEELRMKENQNKPKKKSHGNKN